MSRKDYFPEQEKIIKLLNVLFPDATIFLFGSRARGDHTVRSDIDLAVDMGIKVSSIELGKARNVIESLNIAQTVDIVDYNSVPPELRHLIDKEGKILWKK